MGNDDLIINVKKEMGEVALVYFKFQHHGNALMPNAYVYSEKRILYDSEEEADIKFSYSLFRENASSRYLFIALSNRNEEKSAMVQLHCSRYSEKDDLWKEEEMKKEQFFFSMIFVLGLGFLFWVIVTCIRACIKRQQIDLIEIPIVFDEIIEVRDNKKFFELIEEAMPSRNFSTFDMNLKEKCSACPVCLADFEDEDNCRLTICLHIFHADCIDEWMQRHKVYFLF